MYHLRLLKLFIFILFPIAVDTYASTSIEAKQILKSYEASLNNTATKIHTTEGRIKNYDRKIADAREKLSNSELELVTARRELIQAQHDKSEEAARKQELAQKRYDLIERGTQNRTKRLSRLVRKLGELKEEHKKLLASSQSLQSKIRRQAEKVLQLTTQEKKANAAAKIAKAQPTPEPTKPKIEEPAPAPVIRVEESQVAETSTDDENDESAELADATGFGTEQQLTNKPASPQTKKQDIQNPSTKNQIGTEKQRAYAQRQMNLLSQKTRDDAFDKEWNRYKDLEIKIRKHPTEEFEFLGNYQYYIETELDSGKQMLKIGKRHYRVELKDTGTYIIIFDTTDADKPKFSIFNKAWTE